MFKEILNEIKKFDTILLTQHINPDGDALGSSLGLKEFIKHNFPKKTVRIIGTSWADYLNFLGEFDTLENINISESLLIVSDTANVERIDFSRWKECKKIIKIDHHMTDDQFGDINLVEPKTIANCEIIFKLLEYSKLELNSKILEPVLLGTITDSGRFLFPKTSSGTFELAKKCLEYKVDIIKLYDNLYISDLNQFKFKKWLFNNVNLENVKSGFSYVIIKEKDFKKNNISIDSAKAYVNILSGIDEVKIWFFVVENKKDDNWKISIRSRGLDLIPLAKQFNGGGHNFSAGCTIANLDELKIFIKALKKYFEN